MVDNDIGAQAPTLVRSIREAEAKVQSRCCQSAARSPGWRPRPAAQAGAGPYGAQHAGHDG